MIYESIKADSLKDVFIKAIEGKILSGQLKISQRLAPEREIAASMKISRTIVHSGLIELAAKGILTVVPRKGTYVNDFRRNGTTALLDSILNYTGRFDIKLLESLVEARFLFERETARLAALKRTEEDIGRLEKIIYEESQISSENIDIIADLDFSFHHEIAIISKNIIYPLLIKSMESAYKALTKEFFNKTHQYKTVFSFHKKLYEAVKDGSAEKAGMIMEDILKNGEELLLIYNYRHLQNGI